MSKRKVSYTGEFVSRPVADDCQRLWFGKFGLISVVSLFYSESSGYRIVSKEEPLNPRISTKTWNDLQPPKTTFRITIFIKLRPFSDNFVTKFLLAPFLFFFFRWFLSFKVGVHMKIL